jgi:AcrR family transcriptional regulator
MTDLEDSGTDAEESLSYRAVLADQKAETRRRILSSARAVFLRSGFMDANLNEVAASAGVGKGTLYRHFENKGELYVAMLSENGDAFAREMAETLDPRASVLKQIEQVGHFYLAFWERHPEHFQIIWALQNRELIGPLTPELMDHVQRVFEAPLRFLEGLIRRGIDEGDLRPVDPWNAANVLALSANAVVGPIVTGATHVVKRDMRAVYGQLQDLFLAGLAADPEATAQPD